MSFVFFVLNLVLRRPSLIFVGFQRSDVVNEAAQQSDERVEILLTPCVEQGCGESLSCCSQRLGDPTPFLRQLRFVHPCASVSLGRRSTIPSSTQLRDLAAHRGVIAPGAIRQVDHADRAEPLDADQQRKQRPIQRNTGLLEQDIVILGPVHQRDEIDDGGMQASLDPGFSPSQCPRRSSMQFRVFCTHLS